MVRLTTGMKVVNREILDGFRFVGATEILTEGEVYEKAAEMSQKAEMPKPKTVVFIHIDEINSRKPDQWRVKRSDS